MEESDTPRRLSRRTVAKGAAWTVPAIAVVSPSPAMAASPGTVTLTGQNCKLPGNSSDPYENGAVYLATITNTTNAEIEIEITSFSRDAQEQTGSQVAVIKVSEEPLGDCCTNLGNVFTVPANSSGTFALVTEDWGDSGNAALTVEYTVDGFAQPAATGAEGSVLNPMGSNTPCNNATGSCTYSDDLKLCILTAVEVENCAFTDCP